MEIPNNDTTPGEALITKADQHIQQWQAEVRGILPNLPANINVQLDVQRASEKGSDDNTAGSMFSGSTLTPDTILFVIGDDADFSDNEFLLGFKGTVYHEHFHIARGYNHETSTGLSLLDVAIEEGLAVKFEQVHAGSEPWWGKYQGRDQMLATFQEVRATQVDKTTDWSRWKFYDPESDRHWILYRLGTFIADEVLRINTELDITDLVNMSNQQILEKTGLEQVDAT